MTWIPPIVKVCLVCMQQDLYIVSLDFCMNSMSTGIKGTKICQTFMELKQVCPYTEIMVPRPAKEALFDASHPLRSTRPFEINNGRVKARPRHATL